MPEPLTDQVVVLGLIAQGGHCIARLDGRVVFVRGGLPAETVRIRITDASKKKFWRGEVIEVLQAAPERVPAPCPVADQCGGCGFQHVDLAAQRRLKAAVIAEQLRRLAGLDLPVLVEAVPGDQAGLGWRTRMRYLIRDGRIGLRAWRSDDLVELPPGGCRIAHPDGPADLSEFIGGDGELLVTVATSGTTVQQVGGPVLAGDLEVSQRVGGRNHRVRADGFWQVHPGAAETLGQAVLAGLRPQPGERAVDLYCGVGLFAGLLVDAGCQVIGMESDARAISLARRNVPEAKFEVGRIERAGKKLPGHTDLVVLDPPRTGAGASVVHQIAAMAPRRIAYVSCDPATLARDLATFAEVGYAVAELRAFDVFPMTHHVECVAVLTPV